MLPDLRRVRVYEVTESRFNFLRKQFAGTSRRSRSVLVLIAVLCLFGLLLYAVWSDRDVGIVNGFCSSCHVMGVIAGDLIGTPHENFKCTRCHNPPLSLYLRGLAVELGLSRVSVYELQERRLRMEDECVQCHRPQTLDEQRIHVAHFRVISSVESCTICHVNHEMAPESDACLNCHNLDTIRSSHGGFHSRALEEYGRGIITCERCHAQGAMWSIAIPPSNIRACVEGVGCFQCHESLNPIVNVNDCLRCHGR